MTDMNPSIPFVRMMFMDLTLHLVLVYAMPEQAKKDAIDAITKCLASGQLNNRVAASYTLEEIAKAHETIEAGNVFGTVVVTF